MLNVPDEFSVRPSSRIDPEIGITDTTEAELQKLDERIGNPPAGCNRKLRRHQVDGELCPRNVKDIFANPKIGLPKSKLSTCKAKNICGH